MTKIQWSNPGERKYQKGVDRGVLFVDGFDAVPWNGIVSITENPAVLAQNKRYLDGIPYILDNGREEFAATIEAIYSPVEFDYCDGQKKIGRGLYAGQQARSSFHFSYRTLIASDTEDVAGYRIHLVYNAQASPTETKHNTLSDEGEIEPLAWNIATLPALIPGQAPSAHLFVDSTESRPQVVAYLESIIYGTDTEGARMPTPEELLVIFSENLDLTVIDLNDGSFNIIGTVAAVSPLSDVEYLVDSHMVTTDGDVLIFDDAQ